MSTKKIIEKLKILLSGTIYVVFGVFIISPIVYGLMQIFLLKVIFDRLKREKIKWAPLRVPMKRRLQTIGGLYAVTIVFLLTPTVLLSSYVLMYYFNNIGRAIIVLTWILTYYCHHNNVIVENGNGWINVRQNILGYYARIYFPAELVKTAELKPDKNYLLASFPHGIITFGPAANMCVDISTWLKKFPGVRPKLATLDVHFCVPFVNFVYLGLGLISISKKSLLYYLSKSNDPKHADNQDGFTSNAILVSVGGANEARANRLGQYNLTLKNRKGFVKVAIISGASIVPSFTFNEVETYDQEVGEEGSVLYIFQNYVKKMFEMWPTMVIGRGIFQYSFGILPRRMRLVQVVGAPIEVQQSDNPDAAYVDEIHQKFIKALTELFEQHKTKYLYTKDAPLNIT